MVNTNPFIKASSQSSPGASPDVGLPLFAGSETPSDTSPSLPTQPQQVSFARAGDRLNRMSAPSPDMNSNVKLDATDFYSNTKSSQLGIADTPEATPAPGTPQVPQLPKTPEPQNNITDAKKPPRQSVTDEPNPTDTTDKSPSRWHRFTAFCRRHIRAIIAILAVIIILIVLFFIDRNMRTVHLSLPADGLRVTYGTNDRNEPTPVELPVRLLAYNADIGSPNELLYYIDTTATVTPNIDGNIDTNVDSASGPNGTTSTGIISVKWDVPDSARYRSTYNELCIRDEGKIDKQVDSYCTGMDNNATGNSTNVTASYQSVDSIITINTYNKVSCAYYIPAHTVGLVAWLSGWDRLNQNQIVGCAGNAKHDNTQFGNGSYLNSVYGFGAGNMFSNTGLSINSGRDLSGRTMQNFFQSILNAYGSNIYAGDIIRNSLSNDFSYNDNTHVISLSPTGVLPGQSCDARAYLRTTTENRPAAHNGTDNSTTQTYTCVPTFNVDRYGRITGVTYSIINYDAVHGNEVVGVTGSNSGLTRNGAGTYMDPYTLALSINNKSLKIEDNQVAVIAPQCTAKQNPQVIDPTNGNRNPKNAQDASKNKLQWTYDSDGFGYFTCVHDVDNQQLDIDTGEESHDEDGNVNTTTTTVSLTGDNASSIQFVNTDTRYTAAYGIRIDPTNDNAVNVDLPLNCDGYDSVNGVDNTNRQVLTWDDANGVFVCRSGTDFFVAAEHNTDGSTDGSNINIGDNDTVTFNADGTKRGVTTIGNSNGLIATRNGRVITYTVKIGAGLRFNSSGDIEVAGIGGNDGGNIAACTGGQGLSWDGNSFICKEIYYWNLAAGGGAAQKIAFGGTADFRAAGNAGLSVSKPNGTSTVTYSLNLRAGGGLEFANGGLGLLTRCSEGQVLKYIENTAGILVWDCADDNNTPPATDFKNQSISINNNWDYGSNNGGSGDPFIIVGGTGGSGANTPEMKRTTSGPGIYTVTAKCTIYDDTGNPTDTESLGTAMVIRTGNYASGDKVSSYIDTSFNSRVATHFLSWTGFIDNGVQVGLWIKRMSWPNSPNNNNRTNIYVQGTDMSGQPGCVMWLQKTTVTASDPGTF